MHRRLSRHAYQQPLMLHLRLIKNIYIEDMQKLGHLIVLNALFEQVLKSYFWF